jgi:hypothetical protein
MDAEKTERVKNWVNQSEAVPTSVSGQDKGKKKRLAANFPSNQTN